MTSLSNTRTDILQTDTEMQGLENSDEPLDDILEQVKIMVSAYGTLTDWNKVIESKKIQLSSVEKNLANHQTNQKNATDKQARLTDAYTALESEYALFTKQYQIRNEAVEEELKSLGIKLHNLSRTGEELRTKRRNLSSAVESLKNKLAGTITCPACKHQFLVADKEFDVIAGQQELSKKQHSLVLIGNEITEAEQHCITVEKKQRTITADRQAIRQKKMNGNNSCLQPGRICRPPLLNWKQCPVKKSKSEKQSFPCKRILRGYAVRFSMKPSN